MIENIYFRSQLSANNRKNTPLIQLAMILKRNSLKNRLVHYKQDRLKERRIWMLENDITLRKPIPRIRKRLWSEKCPFRRKQSQHRCYRQSLMRKRQLPSIMCRQGGWLSVVVKQSLLYVKKNWKEQIHWSRFGERQIKHKNSSFIQLVFRHCLRS